ncbi:MAG: ScyD/ScyE family protein [Nocardioides sp.]
MRRTRIVAAAAALSLAATSATLIFPSEAAAPQPTTLATDLVSPLTTAIDDDGTAYVTQNFAGLLSKVRPGKKPRTVYASSHGNEVGGVSVLHEKLVFTETANGPDGFPVRAWVKWITPRGKVRTLADVRAYEDRRNPDGRFTYGVRGISSECEEQWPVEEFGPATYRGLPDSHPYATLQTDQGITLVADAGMNAVLAISAHGRIRTLAVTPPVPVEMTPELAGALGVPDCVVGMTYYGESVPTDIALTRHGRLLVLTEGGGLGEQLPLGAIHSLKLRTGKLTPWVDGLATPTGLAVARNGDTYVAELFGGRISRIKRGTSTARTFAEVNLPAAVEWTRRGLYATVDALVGPSEEDPTIPPGGRLVRFGR